MATNLPQFDMFLREYQAKMNEFNAKLMLLREAQESGDDLKEDNLLEMQKCKATIQQMSEKMMQIETVHEYQAQTLSYLLFKDRSRNLIMYNVTDPDEPRVDANTQVMNVMNQCDVPLPTSSLESCVRLGPPELANRPIKLTFVSMAGKKFVMSNVGKLKRNGFSVSNDLSREQRLDRRFLNEVRKALASRGYRSKLRDTKLIFDNVPYDVHNVKDLLVSLNMDMERARAHYDREHNVSFVNNQLS